MKLPYTSKHPLPSALEQRVIGANNDRAIRYLKVDGLTVKYIGPGEEDSQAASIRANYPAPADLPIYYFEVEIISKGEQGFIGVGLAAEDVASYRLPGWEPRSYGYHGDDGCIFNGTGRASPFGPTYTTGDVVGVLWHRQERSITFYKNGTELGTAFSDVEEDRLFPVVGMRTREEEVRVNFGSQPFKTDVAGLVAAYTQSVHADISAVALPGGALGKQQPLLPRLLFDHLVHERRWQTAAVVARDVLGGCVTFGAQQIEEIKGRQAIYDAVLSGQIDTALQQVQQRYSPELLPAHPRLHFRLKVQHFVEQLRPGAAGPEAALLYGRSELGPAAKGTPEDELFIDALSLLAYSDPAASPAGHLLHQKHRQQLAEQLNDAIMAHNRASAAGEAGAAGEAAAAGSDAAAGGSAGAAGAQAGSGQGQQQGSSSGSSSGSALERVYRQGAAAVAVLQELGDLQACEVEPRQLCLEGL